MSVTDSANESTAREFKTIDRQPIGGDLHASVEVDTSELSAPRTNHVHGIAELVEQRIAAETGDELTVELTGDHGAFTHIDCDRVAMRVVLDASEASDEAIEDAVGTIVECEDVFFEAFEETRHAALN